MSEKFNGLVEVQDNTANPKVRVVLSGEDGSARFGADEINKPVTTLTSRNLPLGELDNISLSKVGIDRLSNLIYLSIYDYYFQIRLNQRVSWYDRPLASFVTLRL